MGGDQGASQAHPSDDAGEAEQDFESTAKEWMEKPGQEESLVLMPHLPPRADHDHDDHDDHDADDHGWQRRRHVCAASASASAASTPIENVGGRGGSRRSPRNLGFAVSSGPLQDWKESEPAMHGVGGGSDCARADSESAAGAEDVGEDLEDVEKDDDEEEEEEVKQGSFSFEEYNQRLEDVLEGEGHEPLGGGRAGSASAQMRHPSYINSLIDTVSGDFWRQVEPLQGGVESLPQP
jgi:hypothetical protein